MLSYKEIRCVLVRSILNYSKDIKRQKGVFSVKKIKYIIGVSVVLVIGFWFALSGNMQKKKVVCVGDSITYGSGVGRRRKSRSYPAVPQKKLGDDYQVLNYGLRSRTLLDYGSYPYTKEAYYKRTLKEKADIYIIMLGTNDSKIINWNTNDYKQRLNKFVESYQNANKDAHIYIMRPSRCFPDKTTGRVKYAIQNEHIEDEIYKSVAEVGQERGVAVIDLYHLTEKHPDWFKDGVHPNAKWV